MGSHRLATPVSAAKARAEVESRAILDATRRIVRLLRVPSRQIEQDLGVTSAQLFVLEQLALGPVTSLKELAARTLTHQSSASVVVARLVELGLVARTPSALDARRTELSLTPRGRALLKQAPATPQSQLVATLQALAPAERAALLTGMTAWIGALGIADEPPTLFFEEEHPRRRRRASQGGSHAG